MFKIKFQSDDLQSALGVIGKVVNGKASMPICDCVHFIFLGKDMILEGTDGTTYVRTRVHYESEQGQPDNMCINIAWLRGIIAGNEGTTTLHLTVAERGKDFSISCETSDSRVNGNAVNDMQYPKYYWKEKYCNMASYSYSFMPLMNALKSVMYATANDEIRMIMTGVYIEDQGDGITDCVGTDGRILACKSVHVAKQYEKFSGVFSKSVINLLSQIVTDTLTITQYCNTKEDGGLEPTTHVCLTCGDFYIYADLIEGRYPNYKGVMQNISYANTCRVSRANYNAAVKRTSNYCNSSSGLFAIRFMEEGKIKIFGQNLDNDSSISDTLPAFIGVGHNADGAYLKADVTLGMSSVLTLKALQHIDGGMLQFYYVDPSRPIVIFGADETLYTLLMPMLLENFDPDTIGGELIDQPAPKAEQTEDETADEDETAEEDETADEDETAEEDETADEDETDNVEQSEDDEITIETE